MQSLLSSISGKFSVSLLLGTFFPVTIFVILARLLAAPMLPGGLDLPLLQPLRELAEEDETWEVILILLTSVVLSGLLYNLNNSLSRLMQGYTWQNTRRGSRKKTQNQEALDALNAQKEGLPALAQEIRRQIQNQTGTEPEESRKILEERLAAVRGQLADAARDLNYNFPKRSSVLPTRLGNVIRSTENYPQWQYGMSFTPLWPVLNDKISPGYAARIDEAKANLDFMLNASVLSALLALMLLLAGFLNPAALNTPQAVLVWAVQMARFAALAQRCYVQSVEHARAWGAYVRGSFDLYRWELLKQLGYEQKPTSAQEERELWGNISRRILFGDPPQGAEALILYKPAPAPPAQLTSVKDETGAALELLRTAHQPGPGSAYEVRIEVRNLSAAGPAARGVVVTDRLPEGYTYGWSSAAASQGQVRVTGSNPYQFHLSEPLGPGAAVTLSYRMAPSLAQAPASEK